MARPARTAIEVEDDDSADDAVVVLGFLPDGGRPDPLPLGPPAAGDVPETDVYAMGI